MTSRRSSGGNRSLDDDRLAADALDDATAFAWLNQLVRRLLTCLAALVAAFLIAVLPIPYVSLAQLVMHLYWPPSPGELLNGEGFRIYWQYGVILALTLAHPMLVYQALAMLAPPRYCPSGARRLRVTCIGLAAFAVGSLLGHTVVLPIVLARLTSSWDIQTVYSLVDYMRFQLSTVVLTGFACEAVALVVMLFVPDDHSPSPSHGG